MGEVADGTVETAGWCDVEAAAVADEDVVEAEPELAAFVAIARAFCEICVEEREVPVD